ncbi:aldehyde ferredoxin oxidoreductase family protein [Chloroflexota bacterium]
MTMYGYGKILDVDLSTGEIKQTEIEPEFARKYIGGVGFGSKILYDEVGPDVEPLSPENIVIFSNGPLTGSRAPAGSRTEITTKHPLTGGIGTGNTGGVWGGILKQAGFDVIILRNESEKPVYLSVNDNKAEIKDAGHLWGKDSRETTEILQEDLPGKAAVIAIGQAGENLVRFACPLNDHYHAAGRCGAGVVMGAKKVKAVAVRGANAAPKPARPEEFQDAVKEAREHLRTADKAFWDTGPHDILRGMMIGGKLSVTQEVVKQYVTRKGTACYGCPVTCYNGIAEVKEGKYAGLVMANAERSAIVGQFGGQLGIGNLPAIWKCKDLCNRYGMDFYTASGIIGYAMELYKQGIINKSDTDGLELVWGNEDAIIEMLKKIASREGFGDVLAEGGARASKIIGRGAEQYSVTIKGMDASGDPRRFGGGEVSWSFLANLTNPRGADIIKTTHHHGNQYNPNWWSEQHDMPEDMKEKIYGKPPQELVTSYDGLKYMYKWFEDLHSIGDSMGICFVATHMRIAFGPNYLNKLYSTYTGMDTTPEELIKTAERLFTMFKAYIFRQGLNRKDDNWPDKFYDEPMPDGPSKGARLPRETVDKLLDDYYDLRGWDKKTGIPTKDTLTGLGLDDVAGDLSRLGILPK